MDNTITGDSPASQSYAINWSNDIIIWSNIIRSSKSWTVFSLELTWHHCRIFCLNCRCLTSREMRKTNKATTLRDTMYMRNTSNYKDWAIHCRMENRILIVKRTRHSFLRYVIGILTENIMFLLVDASILLTEQKYHL